MESRQGRVIVIGGCPRVGKTTLAVRLVKGGGGFSRVSLDHLDYALRAGYPEIKRDGVRKFKFIKTLLEKLVDDAETHGINSVVDEYDFSPEDIEKLPFKDKLGVYFLGVPDVPAVEIKEHIRRHDTPADWTSRIDDKYLLMAVKKMLVQNALIREQCEKYGYRFAVTGVGGGRDAALDALYAEITERYGL